METKIQLKHPTGKHAVKMDQSKYDLLSKTIIRCLRSQPLTHKEMLEAVLADFKRKNIQFDGSVEWYMESVKLDLEAQRLIQRIKDKSQLKFQLVAQRQGAKTVIIERKRRMSIKKIKK